MSWYCEIACTDVAEFVEAIDETRSDFGDNMMIYRGHGDASWKLRPTLYRKRYGDMKIEFYLLHNFILLSQRCGLIIPPDAMSYMDLGNKKIGDNVSIYRLRFDERGNIFNYDIGNIAFAMARHAEIPTRHLDFTWDPNVATYFAVQSVIEDFYLKGERLPERFAIWGINYVELLNNFGVIHHDYTNILSLRNQKGLFVYDSTLNTADFDCWTQVPSFEEPLSQIGDSNFAKKITLESTESNLRKLRDFLIRRGITKQYMFPTYENVRDSIMRKYEEANSA